MIFENGKEIPLWPGEPVMSHGNQAGIDILVGSTLFTTVTATEEGGLLVFTAPAGTITLIPQ